MIGAVVAAVLIPLVVVYCYKNAYKRPPNFPPGPPSLPIYGGYYFVRAACFNNLAQAFIDLGNRYKTKLVGLYMAHIPTVIINDPNMIKEMLNHEDLDGRMEIILTRLRSYWKKLGIFFTDGYFWHVQRRFSLRYMRDYGFGRRDESLEEVVANEVKEVLEIRRTGPKYPAEEEVVKGELVNVPDIFVVPFMNGLCHVFFRMTLPRPEYHVLWKVAKGARLFQRSSDDLGGVVSLTPWVKDFAPNWSGYNGIYNGNKAILDFFTKMIKEALDTHDESYDRHFVDVYLRSMKEEQRTKSRTTYSEEQLRLICTDYMFPTASALSSVLMTFIEHMLLRPGIQDKVHEEIDRVVGRDRIPNLDDRRNMPYTEACLRETMRYDTVVPLGVPHRAMCDTKLGGYDIPEGTMIGANYAILHMDKTIWGDPENFRPERFIKDGQLNVASDKSLPFGAGRRLCAGETYARQAMFQVLAGFMQAYHISTADGKPLTKPSERIQGIITIIPDFWIRVMPRN